MTLRIISLICYVVTITLLNVMVLRQGKKIRELERALSEEHKPSDCNYADVIQGLIEDNRRKEQELFCWKRPDRFSFDHAPGGIAYEIVTCKKDCEPYIRSFYVAGIARFKGVDYFIDEEGEWTNIKTCFYGEARKKCAEEKLEKIKKANETK